MSDGEQVPGDPGQAKPDVAIIDFRMPRMNGAECAKRASRNVCRAARYLFLTRLPR